MHTPVLLDELVDGIFSKKDGIYLDCTGGGGGHSKKLLEKLSDKAKLIILDKDEDAVIRLKKIFFSEERVIVIHSSFSQAKHILEDLNINCVDGLMADFGLSNYQLTDGNRGFSFMNDGELDMRMDKNSPISAFEVINNFDSEQIAYILKTYAEESFSKKIANEIIKNRKLKPIKTTKELADIISKAIPKKFHKQGINPATKSFQAIRIFINKELEEIESLLEQIESAVCISGKVGFISFHSLEDRLVKKALKYYEKDCVCPKEFPVCNCAKKQTFKIITKKAIIPSKDEVENNPLSRSAKLRIAMRVQ